MGIFPFINVPFFRVLNTAAISGLVMLLYILEILEKIQRMGLSSRLQSFTNQCAVASLCLFVYFHDNCSNEISSVGTLQI